MRSRNLNPLTVALAVLVTSGLFVQGVAAQITVGDGQSIQDAIDGASDGDTIVVRGYHAENVLVDKEVTIMGRGNATVDGEGNGPCFDVVANNVTLRGLDIINGTNGITTAAICIDNLVVENCDINTSFGDGINADGDNHTYSKNVLENNEGDGIDYNATSPDSSTLFERNRFLHNDGHGLEAGGGQIIAERNKAMGNRGCGMSIDTDDLDEGAEGAAPLGSTVSRNRSQGNEQDGIAVFDFVSPGTLIERNRSQNNGTDGIFIQGQNFNVERNRTDGNLDEGIDADIINSLIDNNRSSNNGSCGIEVFPLFKEGGGVFGGNTVSNNNSRGNGGDGIETFGSDTDILNNKANNNGRNGILAGSFFDEGIQDVDIVVANNKTNHNGHQGIVNNAELTDIDNNRARKNAGGRGPDIAGAGDFGSGSVNSFSGNNFGTGGADTETRIPSIF